MARKFFSRLALSLAVLVGVIVIASPSLVAAVDIKTDAPNCFDSTNSGYSPTECTDAIKFFYGRPMENGKCYSIRGDSASVSIAINEVNCDTVQSQISDEGDSGGVPTEDNSGIKQDSVKAYTIPRDDVINCDGSNPEGLQKCLKANPLVQQFNEIIDFLAIGVSVIVVIMIIVGGLQYISAGSNPQKVSAAKKRIINAVIAFVAFLMLYSVMQWLVPGGLF